MGRIEPRDRHGILQAWWKPIDSISRWLRRRLQGFASIGCDSTWQDPIDARALLSLVVELSGAFSKATDLTIVLTPGLTKELLQGVPTGSPNSRLLDCWATLSSCLTGLSFTVDPADRQLLQPTCLNQLTRLTRLEFDELDPTSDRADELYYALKLPALEVLCVECLGASELPLQCPQLKTLRIERFAIGKLHLQASLEHLHCCEGGDFIIHEGFPISNLIGLTYLSLNVSYDIATEAALFQGLPLMTRLRVLDLGDIKCSLPAILPSSLRDVTLSFSWKRAWDSSVIATAAWSGVDTHPPPPLAAQRLYGRPQPGS